MAQNQSKLCGIGVRQPGPGNLEGEDVEQRPAPRSYRILARSGDSGEDLHSGQSREALSERSRRDAQNRLKFAETGHA